MCDIVGRVYPKTVCSEVTGCLSTNN